MDMLEQYKKEFISQLILNTQSEINAAAQGILEDPNGDKPEGLTRQEQINEKMNKIALLESMLAELDDSI